MNTIIITGREVEKILTPALANKTVEAAFAAYGLGLADMPAKSYLYFDKGDLRSMPAYIHGQDFHIAGIKSVTVHPQNKLYNLPTVMAVIILIDPENGLPLAIMDGTCLTAVRTGAAGAVAAKYLSREDSKTAGFVGCGVQARAQLSCLLEIRRLEKVKIWQFSQDVQCSVNFKEWVETTYHLETIVSSDIFEVTTETDILVTTTPSRNPLVTRVTPGTHINAIGADAAGKQEIDPGIVRKAKIVIDDWSQASHSGEINVPLMKRQISQEDIHADLGRIAAKKAEGRTSADEITLFDATGLAIQDVSCAYIVYKTLKDIGTLKEIELF